MVNPLAVIGVLLAVAGASKLNEKAATASASSSEKLTKLQTDYEAAKEKLADLEASHADGATLREEIRAVEFARDKALNELEAFQAAERASGQRPRRKRPTPRKPDSESSQPAADKNGGENTE